MAAGMAAAAAAGTPAAPSSAATVLGLALGASHVQPAAPAAAPMSTSRRRPRRWSIHATSYAGNPHIAWCTQRYATYNGETDTVRRL